MTVKRSDFQAAIEDGLLEAPDMRVSLREKLRRIGREATAAVYGTYAGCPLSVATVPVARGGPQFAGAYDDTIGRLLREQPDYVPFRRPFVHEFTIEED